MIRSRVSDVTLAITPTGPAEVIRGDVGDALNMFLLGTMASDVIGQPTEQPAPAIPHGCLP
jgi:hypothetical protein